MEKHKILVLGVDGLDPSLTNRFRQQGIMPNFDKLIARGSARKDLRMLGRCPYNHTANVDFSGYWCDTRHSWYYLFLGTIQNRSGYNDL